MAKRKKKKKIVKTLREVSEAFGVSYTTVRQQWRTGGMPVEKDGTYDLVAIDEWRKLRDAGRSASNGDADNLDIVTERKRLENEIKRAELAAKLRQNEIAAGDLVSLAAVDRWVAGFLTMLRDDLERIPLDMRTAFPEDLREDLERMLRNRINLTLRTMMRQQESLAKFDRV